jgi:carbamoyltransferase
MASEHMPPAKDVRSPVSYFREQFENYWKYRILYGLRWTPLYRYYVSRVRRERLKNILKLGFEEKKIVFVNHHLCHAASAYFGSPWRRDKVLVLTLDGGGDRICSTVYIGKGYSLKLIAQTPDDASLGNIYSRVTFMMGFVPWEHEYKIMGLAPYAEESKGRRVYEKFKHYLDLDDKNPLKFKRKIPEPTALIYRRLMKDLALERFDWIARGLQTFTEELILKWVRFAIQKTGIRKLALAGGVFMNVKVNKRIMELPEVEKLFVFPSCGDESNSIGAAFWVYVQKCKEHGNEPNIPPLGPIYFGPPIDRESVELELENYRKKFKFSYTYYENIEKVVGELLAEGEIVARAKGRMEFGARALGNRSILADPSDLNNVRKINMMIKKRDFWMPFAPTILKEREKDYIINPKNIPSPYMILSFDTTEKREEFIGAVHQADYTARPQVLEKSWNEEYYEILKTFEKHTGIGVILNTSFNLHGYPIVYGAKEALWVMENSGLKYLALDNYLIEKEY